MAGIHPSSPPPRPTGITSSPSGMSFSPSAPIFQPDPVLFERLFHPQRGPARLMQEQIFPNIRATYADLVEACADADLLVVGELLTWHRSSPPTSASNGPMSFIRAHLIPFPPATRASSLPRRISIRSATLVRGRIGSSLRLAVSPRFAGGTPAAGVFAMNSASRPAPSPVFDGKHSPSLVLAMFPDFLAQLPAPTGRAMSSRPASPSSPSRPARKLSEN